MAPPFRLPPTSSPRMLGGLAATVLVAALALTGLVLPGGSSDPRPAASPTRTSVSTQAPYRLGGKIECPPAWPVLAMSNHTSYPAGHPAKPPATAAAVACYQTTAKAASAGYAPAPLPAGALEVGGVYLTPTSRRFRAHCQQVADRVGFAVPCPELLPTSPPGLPPPRLCQQPPSCQRGQLLVFSQDFVVPFGAVGAPGGYGVLSMITTPTRTGAGRVGFQCPGERRIATPTIQRTPAVLTACQYDAPWVLGGSLRLRWSQHDTVVVVSVPGPSEANQRLVATVADHLRLVRPTSG
jgi:hypothetical protein